jgi:hypothetical protein
VIARPLPYEDDLRAPAGTRSGREAAKRRRVRTSRLRYRTIAATLAGLVCATLAVVVYLGLMANVTRMNYELAKASLEKARLGDSVGRLDDRIAKLESPERLSALASRLGMREPQTFAAIALPASREAAPRGIAFLTWLK